MRDISSPCRTGRVGSVTMLVHDGSRVLHSAETLRWVGISCETWTKNCMPLGDFFHETVSNEHLKTAVFIHFQVELLKVL